jgi:hypothetical protein
MRGLAAIVSFGIAVVLLAFLVAGYGPYIDVVKLAGLIVGIATFGIIIPYVLMTHRD